jgi:tetratricopeptide (TPR) repeat protein
MAARRLRVARLRIMRFCRNARLVICWGAVLATLAARAEDLEIGQRVVVLRDRSAIVAGNSTVDIVDRGDILRVENVRGSWLLVTRGHAGWIDKGQTVALGAAREYFNKIVAQNPLDPSARAARAALWVDDKSWDAAVAEAGEALRQNPQSLQARLVRSAAYRGKREFDLARADALAAIQLAPALPVGFVAAGDAWREQGNYDRAIADYGAALDRDPNNAHLCLRRGQTRLASCQGEQAKLAVTDFRNAVELGEHDPACQHDALVGQAQAHLMQGSTDRAVQEFTELITQNGNDVPALVGRGSAYGQNRQFEAALRDINRAIPLAPQNPLVFVAAADIRSRQYNVRGALRDVETALKLDPSLAAAYRIRGEVLLKQKKWVAAIEAFGQALALAPNDPATYIGRAKAYTAKGEVFAANTDREQATRIDPSIDPATGTRNSGDDILSTAKQPQSTRER